MRFKPFQPHRRDTGAPTALSPLGINTSDDYTDLSPSLCREIRDRVVLIRRVFIKVLFMLDSPQPGTKARVSEVPAASARCTCPPHSCSPFSGTFSGRGTTPHPAQFCWCCPLGGPGLQAGQSEHCIPARRDWLWEGHMIQSEPMSCDLGIFARGALSSDWSRGCENGALML